MTESPVDVAAIKAEHEPKVGGSVSASTIWCPTCSDASIALAPCLPYRLADALDRAQAASEGVDLLIAQAERRGAAKALRAIGYDLDLTYEANEAIQMRAHSIENGADL